MKILGKLFFIIMFIFLVLHCPWPWHISYELLLENSLCLAEGKNLWYASEQYRGKQKKTFILSALLQGSLLKCASDLKFLLCESILFWHCFTSKKPAQCRIQKLHNPIKHRSNVSYLQGILKQVRKQEWITLGLVKPDCDVWYKRGPSLLCWLWIRWGLVL